MSEFYPPGIPGDHNAVKLACFVERMIDQRPAIWITADYLIQRDNISRFYAIGSYGKVLVDVADLVLVSELSSQFFSFLQLRFGGINTEGSPDAVWHQFSCNRTDPSSNIQQFPAIKIMLLRAIWIFAACTWCRTTRNARIDAIKLHPNAISPTIAPEPSEQFPLLNADALAQKVPAIFCFVYISCTCKVENVSQGELR